jgi:hypothetical protein
MGAEKILMARGPADAGKVRRATFKLTRSGPYELGPDQRARDRRRRPPGMLVRAVS